MRIYTFALMASTSSLLRDTASSGTVNSSLTKGNLPANVDFSDGVNNSGLAEQPLVVRETTSGEERVGPPIPTAFESAVKDAVAKLVTAMHSHSESVGQLDRLTVSVKKHVQALDEYAVMRYLAGRYPEGLTKESIEHVLDSRFAVLPYLGGFSQLQGWVHSLITAVQLTERTKSAEKRAMWLQNGKSPGQVFKELAIAGESPAEKPGQLTNPFASPDFLVLRTYVEQFKGMYDPGYTLLDAFLEGFDGPANLAEFLSTAKLSQFKGNDALDMLIDLLQYWVKHGKKPGDIAGMLREGGKEAESPWFKEFLAVYKVYYNEKYGGPSASSHV
ncbi:unnamed protein product [Hyaloperonospora brassicae]|uniref:RxLR effector candidate protein n=1 Tax=Hyaloperonospora brassicae TaxID=162125 RepID=A0AAV0UBV5_HYABA|nr:unnamed protein product [Hyaloperonospora brassicae]